MKIALLPLDERPANTRYPAHVAAIAGASLVLPPQDALPDLRVPASRDDLTLWLKNEAAQCDGIVASIDLLGYGGLIASRISHDSIDEVLQWITPLSELRSEHRPVFAFNVIQRISNANDATEEPAYWAQYGMRLYRLSREMDLQNEKGSERFKRSDSSDNSPAYTLAVQDWLTRRARNHAVNLAMLREAAMGKFDLLVIPSDDTSPIGLSARERKHLEFWRDALALTALTPVLSLWEGEKVLMYPGADDLGSAMVARMINHKRNHSPRVFVHFTDEAMADNIAPYEDRPIHQAVTTQVMAVGAQTVTRIDEADLVLVVSPPFERKERDPHPLDFDCDERRAYLLPAVQRIAQWVREGRRVAIADVAFPNGAEPAFVELLFEHVDIAKLAAFGGWNTAGNTLGSVLACACVPCDDDRARQIALAHHLLEDWGYQSVVRDDLRSWLSETFGQPVIPPDHLDEATAFTAAWLEPIAQRIRTAGLPCTVSHVRHPWRRTFEVDFEL
jgi:hypothetical protein